MATVLFVFALLAGTPAAVADDAVATKAKVEKVSDPMICETSDQIGSLIRKKRVCMHRSEWKAQRESDREDIERGQVQVPTDTH